MRHAPFFCEENVWHLAHDDTVTVDGHPLLRCERLALFVTNEARAVPTWSQRAGDPVLWDYHVVLFARGAQEWRALDLDTTIGFDVPVARWLDASFHEDEVPAELLPLFRVVPPDALDATFASDRSHMRDALGAPTRPFPPWPPITCPLGPMTLPRYLDTADPIAGEWLTLGAVRERFAAPR